MNKGRKLVDFTMSERQRYWRDRVVAFMARYVYPAIPVYDEQMESFGSNRWQVVPVLEELKKKAKAEGLWLAGDWRRLDDRIAAVSAEIEVLTEQDGPCQRLMTVPGIGPIISSAVVAAIGNGTGFKQGRDFGAWLGLVPKQESTGDRTILGKISKRGNKYLRTLFVQAAHVILARRPRAAMRGLWPWIEQASKRLHRNMLAIALANKLARIAWAVLTRGREYQPRTIGHAA
jgi:transposase